MQRGDQGCHLRLFDILQFVNEKYDRCLGGPGCSTDLGQERAKIKFQVAIIGQARFGSVVDADLDVTVVDFEFAGESSESLETSDREVLGGFLFAEVEKGEAEGWGQDSWK